MLMCQVLLDDQASIFERYAAMFALRNRGGEAAIEALGAAFSARSALLKHEIAYVLGQMQHPNAVDVLR
jgi:deoxyhypusine monooxygenase